MTKKLRDRAEYTASYTSNVTHELKSPITSIRGAAELLRNDIDAMSKEQKDRFVRNIEADALRMERLVNQLLHLARIENATHESETEVIMIKDLFTHLASRYTERVTFSVTTPALSVCMNPDNLTSVVVNLVENALEHDAKSQVTVEASPNKEHVVLCVHDNGPGIPSANISSVFERFFTTKKDGGGTGLGLSLVKAIVEARSGSVRVQSEPGNTKFTVVL
jgi:signal transduction histidine kinase